MKRRTSSEPTIAKTPDHRLIFSIMSNALNLQSSWSNRLAPIARFVQCRLPCAVQSISMWKTVCFPKPNGLRERRNTRPKTATRGLAASKSRRHELCDERKSEKFALQVAERMKNRQHRPQFQKVDEIGQITQKPARVGTPRPENVKSSNCDIVSFFGFVKQKILRSLPARLICAV